MAATVTTELALAWARLPGEHAHPAYLGKRLCVAQGFARRPGHAEAAVQDAMATESYGNFGLGCADPHQLPPGRQLRTGPQAPPRR